MNAAGITSLDEVGGTADGSVTQKCPEHVPQ